MAEAALQNPEVVYSLLDNPAEKIATAMDVANQIVVLASSTVSGHVTGQIIMVDGGMEGRLLNKPEDI
ncbi:hypothetical protein EDC04DRAFT_221630 [Pisolithus marmoratus]|nr:hypothetical protein EDC04DRAFT_221630 [Pisolithus marmoratus]